MKKPQLLHRQIVVRQIVVTDQRIRIVVVQKNFLEATSTFRNHDVMMNLFIKINI